jgi:anti-anti-sigma regulatory factor
MYQAEIDKFTNVLTIRFKERVGEKDAQLCAEEVEKLLVDVEMGFRLLTDLSGLESMDLACLPYIDRVMDFCSKKGVDLVVRVIPDPKKDIGFNLISLFHYRQGVRMATCKTLEEAMEKLEQ